MYATLEESDGLATARALAARQLPSGAGAALPALEEQVCAEAGVWAPDAARRALAQSGGDVPAAVALVRVWAAALAHVAAVPVDPADVRLVRRLSAAYPDIPGGQWLGIAPELRSRLLDWDDDAAGTPAGTTAGAEPMSGSRPGEGIAGDATAATDAPSRLETPRVRDLVTGVPMCAAAEDGGGADPARSALIAPYSRATRLGVLARAETAGLVTLASLVLATRREAVLAEVTAAVVQFRVPHPRTGNACHVATVPIVEADAIIDADVDGQPGFAVGWGASLGSIERRAIALALLDGAAQAGADDAPALTLDEQTVVAATDGAATNGFVEHLRLPHYASFASYLSQARGNGDEEHG